MQDVEVWVCINDIGEYAVSMYSKEDAMEQYTSIFGKPTSPISITKLTASLPKPIVATVTPKIEGA